MVRASLLALVGYHYGLACGLLLPRGAVIIGGGPSGLAAALQIRKSLPGTTVTVVERAPDPRAFDAERSFLYLLDGRGQRFTDAFGLTSKVAAEVGVAVGDGFNVTVCPPGKPGSESGGGGGSAQRKVVELKLVDRKRKTPYWVSRNGLAEVLLEACERDPGIDLLMGFGCEALKLELEAPPLTSKVKEAMGIESGVSLGVGQEAGAGAPGLLGAAGFASGPIEVELLDLAAGEGASPAPGRRRTLRPNLVVGADGAKSNVREELRWWVDLGIPGLAHGGAQRAAAKAGAKAKGAGEGGGESGGELGAGGAEQCNRFELESMPSPAAGLRYKVLALPGGFPLDPLPTETEAAAGVAAGAAAVEAVGEGAGVESGYLGAKEVGGRKVERAIPGVTYSFRSAFEPSKFPLLSLRASLLPRRHARDPRTANFITRPDHALWTVRAATRHTHREFPACASAREA
mmetsp:Transcript_33033/g.74579  ORF Transcript_33033/g.74579 Transcript_33033/m.74579 type:complete len:460 (+) Transcript_33033:29-1408(+)